MPKLNGKREKLRKKSGTGPHNNTAIKKIRKGNSQETPINPPAFKVGDLLVRGKD